MSDTQLMHMQYFVRGSGNVWSHVTRSWINTGNSFVITFLQVICNLLVSLFSWTFHVLFVIYMQGCVKYSLLFITLFCQSYQAYFFHVWIIISSQRDLVCFLFTIWSLINLRILCNLLVSRYFCLFCLFGNHGWIT